MKINTYYLPALLLLLLFVTCRKPVAEVAPDFIGTWVGDGTYNTQQLHFIIIDGNSLGTYFHTAFKANYDKPDKNTKYKDGILKIGLKRVVILSEPEPFDTLLYPTATWNWPNAIQSPRILPELMMKVKIKDEDEPVVFFKLE
jgi:hypothetical protein